MVENIMDFSDLIAIDQGIKKFHIEPVEAVYVEPEEVFASLEESRKNHELTQNVTKAVIYYEASKNRPGMIDRMNIATGKRCTGKFHNGEFEAVKA
jgi:oxalate decarboxylase/phosphoglucose isomerase-like protein (cupin superfamily)